MASKNKNLSIAASILSNDISGIIRKIPIQQITPSEDQPRLNKDINIEKLSKSITEEGLLQPIIVTKIKDNNFKIIAGERRYRAAVMAGWLEIECKILDKNSIDTFRIAVIENLQREDFNPVEESLAYKKLKDLFSYTDQQLAEIIGKSRNYISEILSIADIPENLRLQAFKTGIKSRNLLVQFAQAIKNNRENEFLLNFQKGNISSVKSAKNFIKEVKLNSSKEISKQKDKKIFASNHPLLHIQSKWVNEKQISIEIDIKNIENINIPLNNIEKHLEKSLVQFLSN
ncbi:MAG: ParB/RepB/Spo0J family partition protein [Spirochaetia bacterium]|nr:ParB/RepB/Spo0J family partition protein [Spirochaetia bacterium]